VIADHSPKRVLETGLLVKAREKNPCNESAVARASFSLVRFAIPHSYPFAPNTHRRTSSFHHEYLRTKLSVRPYTQSLDRIVSAARVRPQSMPPAEITYYKKTSQD
jgi:hypothetical protein